MKLVDLDGVMFVPVVDETHGGAVVEMKMTVGEFFEKCCAGFAPEAVEAIPVEWLKDAAGRYEYSGCNDSADVVMEVIKDWQKEQEAQDG